MASRWAFEAAMVTQFKDNRFEKEFYLYDKVMANSDFQKVYLIPEIETRLQYCLLNYQSKDPLVVEAVKKDFDLIRYEIEQEIEELDHKRFGEADQLNLQRFDSAVYRDLTNFLEHLKQHYVNRYNKADQLKEQKIRLLTASSEQAAAFQHYREAYHNEAITDLVKNLAETHRVIEKDGKLVQKLFPSYKDPDPDHLVDFDAQFYMPAKHFMRSNVDTFFFNTRVIWSMTLALAIALYFDVLRRIVGGIENLSNPMNRRIDK
jgi:hypothetical protein